MIDRSAADRVLATNRYLMLGTADLRRRRYVLVRGGNPELGNADRRGLRRRRTSV
jgi:hypothetical protein